MLIYRYTTRELDAFMSKITTAVEKERLSLRNQISDKSDNILMDDVQNDKSKNSQGS